MDLVLDTDHGTSVQSEPLADDTPQSHHSSTDLNLHHLINIISGIGSQHRMSWTLIHNKSYSAKHNYIDIVLM